MFSQSSACLCPIGQSNSHGQAESLLSYGYCRLDSSGTINVTNVSNLEREKSLTTIIKFLNLVTVNAKSTPALSSYVNQ